MDEKVILAYASQYKEKYFFNDELGKLPQAVRNEALMCLIMIVEEAGGVAELGFYPDGEIYLDSYCEEGDLGYDEISGGLLVREVERDHAELLEQLELWYRTIMEAKRR
ncbi:MAG: hypothetical protein IKL38_06760 [Firmicutes bacterium]|nr:hypothetical protein [Bacillota bacterium]